MATGDFLEKVYAQLRRACTGTLLGPPLISPKGEVAMSADLDDRARDLLAAGIGSVILMKAEYLDEFPKELEEATSP